MERAEGVKEGSREEVRVVSRPMATPPQRQDYEGWLEVLGVSKLREPGISPSFTVPEPNCHFPPTQFTVSGRRRAPQVTRRKG